MKELSEDQVRRILKEKLGVHLSKPYPQDYRRPENAEEILRGRPDLTMHELEKKGYTLDDIAIGFIDESSPQNTANTVRVWSFGKPHRTNPPSVEINPDIASQSVPSEIHTFHRLLHPTASIYP